MLYKQLQQGRKETELDSLINASGKMVLLFKLLPKLHREGHKVTHTHLASVTSCAHFMPVSVYEIELSAQGAEQLLLGTKLQD